MADFHRVDGLGLINGVGEDRFVVLQAQMRQEDQARSEEQEAAGKSEITSFEVPNDPLHVVFSR